MAMNGLEKITDKILAEAQAESEKILSQAQEACERIRTDYNARADEIRERLSAEAEREGTELITRAKSAAATQKRNALLNVRGELIDEVFDSTLAGIRSLDGEKYTEVLAGLLSAALLEQLEAEVTSRTIYGEEEALAPARYEVVFNPNDRDRYGAAVLESARKRLSGKAPAEKLDMLALSDKTVSIDGGFILRCGDIESNCSLELLFAQLRRELESEVSHALFDPKGRF